MTTIVMVEKPNLVQIAWDSKVSRGYSHEELEQEKVFEASGITYGVAGEVRVANILESLDVKPPQGVEGKAVDAWVSRVLIPRMQFACREADPEGQYYVEANILVVVNGRVYSIGRNFSRVRNTSGVYAIGSGSTYAKGALSAGASPEKAVQIAADNDMATGHGIKTKVIRK